MIELSLRTVESTEILPSGFVGVQVDTFGAAPNNGVPGLELASPFGLWGRPMDPDVGPDGEASVGCSVLVLTEDGEEWTIPTSDPRYMPLLPDPGKGGVGVWAPVLDGAAKKVGYLLFSGAGGPTAAGSLKIHVPDTAGTGAYEVTIDRQARTVTIAHPDWMAGAPVVVTSAAVQLGGTGGQAPALATPIVAWAAGVNAALAAAGHPAAPLAAVAALKVLVA